MDTSIVPPSIDRIMMFSSSICSLRARLIAAAVLEKNIQTNTLMYEYMYAYKIIYQRVINNFCATV